MMQRLIDLFNNVQLSTVYWDYCYTETVMPYTTFKINIYYITY